MMPSWNRRVSECELPSRRCGAAPVAWAGVAMAVGVAVPLPAEGQVSKAMDIHVDETIGLCPEFILTVVI